MPHQGGDDLLRYRHLLIHVGLADLESGTVEGRLEARRHPLAAGLGTRLAIRHG